MAFKGIEDIYGWVFRNSQEKKILAPYVKPENDTASLEIGGNYFGQQRYQLNIEQAFTNELDLILRYREVALNPEVDTAITDIVNEAIVSDDDVDPVTINLDRLDNMPGITDAVKKVITDEFNTIKSLLKFNADCFEIFKKWYVDGRIAYLKIIDPANPKDGLKELRYIPSINIKKFREQRLAKTPEGIDVIAGFTDYFIYTREIVNNQTKTSAVGIKLTGDSVCFCHSGLIDEKENLIYSYLHKALKAATQLRILEDAVLIYTLARAPHRRIFYIDVGNLPKNKAEEYLKSVQNRFKNKMVYDANTGQIKDSNHILSMMEDIWLPRRDGSRGTEIGQLEGGQIGGQVDIVKLFKDKLYQSLNVPMSRIADQQGGGGFNVGRPSEITREELKFSHFVKRLRKNFSDLFLDLLRTQLMLKQIVNETDWNAIKEKIGFNYQSDSSFKELRDADLLRERIALLDQVKPYIGIFFSLEQVHKEILQRTDEEIEAVEKQIEEEQDKLQELAAMMNPEAAQVQNGPDQEAENQPDPDDDMDDNWQEVPENPKNSK